MRPRRACLEKTDTNSGGFDVVGAFLVGSGDWAAVAGVGYAFAGLVVGDSGRDVAGDAEVVGAVGAQEHVDVVGEGGDRVWVHPTIVASGGR